MIGAEGRGRLFGGKYLTGVCKIFPRRKLLLKKSPGYQLSTVGLVWVFPVHHQAPSLGKNGLSWKTPPTMLDWAGQACLLHICHPTSCHEGVLKETVVQGA